MNPLQLEISNQHDSLACPVEATRNLLHSIAASGAFPIAEGELSIAFVTDSAIAKIHQTFMNDPSPTDVITFPPDPAMHFAGEIIVSVDHALEQSTAFKEPFSRELSLYLIHGWLHLAGYDDRTEADRTAMRKAEQKALTIADSTTQSFRIVNSEL